ncbi:MAG: translation elongation factor Ts [Acidobacteria bacterium]|nr:MAG: translation elongation factor Ts [Acidobacteriota bacterium]
MAVTAQDVAKLRAMTGAGMMDCKQALTAAGGDFDKAVEELRKRGLSKAAKKAGRETKEGIVSAYIHPGGRVGVLLEVNCETDFVARTDDFKSLVHDLAMQIAAAAPQFVSREQVTPEVLDKEREIYREQLKDQGKPEHIVEKIIEGKLGKFYEEVCLLEQPFIKDPDKKVSQVIQEAIAKLGENIQVARFARFELGRG